MVSSCFVPNESNAGRGRSRRSVYLKCSAYGCIIYPYIFIWGFQTHRTHECYIIYHQYNIPKKMLAYIPYMDPMGNNHDHAKHVQTYVGKLPRWFDTNPPAIHGVVFYAIMNPYLVGGSNPSQEKIWHFNAFHPIMSFEKNVFLKTKDIYVCVPVRNNFYYHY